MKKEITSATERKYKRDSWFFMSGFLWYPYLDLLSDSVNRDECLKNHQSWTLYDKKPFENKGKNNASQSLNK